MTTDWYPYRENGSFYRLHENTLFQAPMNADGSMASRDDFVANEDGMFTEVDMDMFREDVLYIIEDLKKKEEESIKRCQNLDSETK
jgi:hypothetical protein